MLAAFPLPGVGRGWVPQLASRRRRQWWRLAAGYCRLRGVGAPRHAAAAAARPPSRGGRRSSIRRPPAHREPPPPTTYKAKSSGAPERGMKPRLIIAPTNTAGDQAYQTAALHSLLGSIAHHNRDDEHQNAEGRRE